MARFYLDNDVAHALARLLEVRGHAAETARGLGLADAGDEVQLLTAARRRAALVTHNRKDFRLLHGAWRTWAPALGLNMPPHYGILALDHASPEILLEALDVLLVEVAAEARQNAMYSWKGVSGWTQLWTG